jgi:hypothetical protein
MISKAYDKVGSFIDSVRQELLLQERRELGNWETRRGNA